VDVSSLFLVATVCASRGRVHSADRNAGSVRLFYPELKVAETVLNTGPRAFSNASNDI
jgi:hypothetical protein